MKYGTNMGNVQNISGSINISVERHKLETDSHIINAWIGVVAILKNINPVQLNMRNWGCYLFLLLYPLNSVSCASKKKKKSSQF